MSDCRNPLDQPVQAAREPWRPARREICLGGGQVHVWRASLDQPEEVLGRLAETLSTDERQRAERFRFPQHRRRFAAGRGILRAILGSCLGVPPEQLLFCYGPHGKPSLQREIPLRFNLAHSQDLALCAVTLGREVGVDLEAMRAEVRGEQLADRFFSPREVAALFALPSEARQEAFFTCWSRKEAVLKAKGGGLSIPLDQFAVSLAPGEPARLLTTEWDPAEAARWSLVELFPGDGFKAALAVEGNDWNLHCWEWHGP
jgi:4'-phosphopantetheinyl transferase